MTQEEKARAYDEALERARQIKNGENGWGYSDLVEITPALEEVFPQLREGEDEKIRKKLIQFLTDIKSISESGRTSWAVRKEDAEMCATFLAYLEKQKEQKPNIELIQRSWYMEGYHDREFGKEPMWIIKTGEGGPKHELNPKYGQPLADEQKPETFNEPYNPDDYEVVIEGNATSLKQKEQKPAEWSEEDESELTAVIYCVSRAIKASKDENERNSLLSAKKWLQDKLSFRVKSIHPSWKSSEEQMEELWNVVSYIEKPGSNFLGVPVLLESLYEDLKKL